MIKAVGTDGQGKTLVILGLSRENTRRLHKDEPIVMNLAELATPGVELPDVSIMILAGESEAEISTKLGRPMPQPKYAEKLVWERETDA